MLNNWSRWLAPFAILAGVPYVLKPLWGLICNTGDAHSHGGVCNLTLPSEIFAEIMTLLALVAVFAVQAHVVKRFGFFSFVSNFIFTTMMIGVNSFAFLYEDMILGGRFDPPPVMMIIFMVALFGWILTSVLFGISIMRARVMPRWAAIAFMIAPLLNLAPNPFYLIGAVLLGASLIGMGMVLWRLTPDGGTPVSEEESKPA